MCGIWGVFGTDLPVRYGELAMRSLAKRGPDATGSHNEPGLTLGHLRLAIIDLTEAGAQPMYSACGRYVIVYNGEIYNFADIRVEIGDAYPWRSHSDTEVILAAYIKWGVKCLERFHGMFAFALWDKHERRLFVGRDRLGVKPIYFHADAGQFAFASRPRALFDLLPSLSRQFDQQALRYYYEAGYIPAPHSIYSSVRKLEPGHFLIVDDKGVSKNRYWTLEHIETDETLESASEEMLLDQLDAIIDRSIRQRMVSNVPVGAFLSGGIDSSLVAALMVRHADAPVKTFTIGFGDSAFDESQHAEAVARHLGTDHTCERLEADDLLSLMPNYLEEYDEPFFDYSAFPVMAVSRMARQHVKVSLSGDGGDEAFGGYHYYRIMKNLAPTFRLPGALRKGVGTILQRVPKHHARLLGHALQSDDPVASFAFMRSIIKDSTDILSPALTSSTQSLGALFEQYARRLPASLNAAERSMRIDAAFTLPDDYLQKVDVGSMAFSLEARDPLLDHSIFEWAARLPLKWKVRNGTNKYLLRQLAYRYIPREILDRPKMGFGVPMARWLRTSLREWADGLLHDSAAFGALGLNHDAVLRLWQQHLAGQREAHTCLWSVLVMLQFQKNMAV
ncbi:asparagine synthase (glutamine-hydrolyzing) [Paraburkholderia sp. A2WS-5]|uniref:asparagine synthase (glutamine-hydrolyzing) n=1 Tax=Paraburkholderia sp. A2WS-5 TaxID=3028372 RepID=UPI003B7DE0EB